MPVSIVVAVCAAMPSEPRIVLQPTDTVYSPKTVPLRCGIALRFISLHYSLTLELQHKGTSHDLLEAKAKYVGSKFVTFDDA